MILKQLKQLGSIPNYFEGEEFMTQSKSEMKAFFNRHVKGENFMTPTQIDFSENKDYIFELSIGESFLSNEKLFGVTCLNKETKEINHDLSKCFNDKKEAINYIERFKNGS